MPVCHEKKLIMIHIPKNAGTSVGIGLGMNYGGGHLTALELKNNGYPHWEGEHSEDKLKQVYIDDWDSYFKFAIVRNPFDRVVSNYEFIKSENSFWHMINPDGSKPVWNESICPPKDIHPEYEKTSCKSFKEVVKEIPRRMENSYGWREQWPFILDENGNNMMDYICRYENIDDYIHGLCSHLDIKYSKLLTLNKSHRRDYKEYYDDETIEIVSNIYKKDLDIFNYEF